jgi:cation transport regulator ChaC
MSQESGIVLPNGDMVLCVPSGCSVIFGYGSLMLKESMENTLGHAYRYSPLQCTLAGWRRRWSVMMPNDEYFEHREAGDFVPKHVVYLNIEQAVGATVNGAVYVVDHDQLISFDRREWIYDRIRVTEEVRGLHIPEGEVYAYVGKPEWRVPANCLPEFAGIRRSYVAVIERALSVLGPQFRFAYEQSSDDAPPQLLFLDRKRAV